MKAVCPALAIALLLGGCATPLNKAPDLSESLTAAEGIVVGSALLRVGTVEDAAAVPVAPMFLVPSSSLRYSLEAGPDRSTRAIIEKPVAGEMRLSLLLRPGKEEVFMTRMAAGPHVFFRLVPQGYEDAAGELGIGFTVAPGTTTYIGRVILDLPEKLPLASGLPKGLYSLRPRILIEDAEQATLDSIRGTRGVIVEGIARDLMRAD